MTFLSLYLHYRDDIDRDDTDQQKIFPQQPGLRQVNKTVKSLRQVTNDSLRIRKVKLR